LVKLFEKNSKVKGVIDPGIQFLTNIAKINEG